MGAGLQIFNDSGFIQIDADYLNLEFKYKGSVTLAGSNAQSGGGVTSTIVIDIVGEAPHVAFRASGYVVGYFVSRNGNTSQFWFYNNESSNTTIEYYVFDSSSANGSGNTGFQVFNPAGRLVFDSNKKYMKVLDYWDDNRPSQGAEDRRTYANKKVALVMCDYGYNYVVAPSPIAPNDRSKAFIQSWLVCMKSESDSTVVLTSKATYTNTYANSPGVSSFSEGPSRWLALDVTNY